MNQINKEAAGQHSLDNLREIAAKLIALCKNHDTIDGQKVAFTHEIKNLLAAISCPENTLAKLIRFGLVRLAEKEAGDDESEKFYIYPEPEVKQTPPLNLLKVINDLIKIAETIRVVQCEEMHLTCVVELEKLLKQLNFCEPKKIITQLLDEGYLGIYSIALHNSSPDTWCLFRDPLEGKEFREIIQKGNRPKKE